MYLIDEQGVRPSKLDGDSHFKVVTSASDLKHAAACEWAFLRKLDGLLGRAEKIATPEDLLRDRAGALGDKHEADQLAAYKAQYGDRVVEVARTSPDAKSLKQAAAETVAAFSSDAAVVFQATFFEEELPEAPGIGFVGYADFIVRTPSGAWRVQDTKVGRTVRVEYLLQLAAYAHHLAGLGFDVDDTVEVLLGSGETSSHRLVDIMPVFLNRRSRMHALIAEHLIELDAVAWGDDRYSACGRCEYCAPAVEEHRDVLLVAQLRVSQRARLRAAGIHTIEELASSSGSVAGMRDAVVETLRGQAKLQIESERGDGIPSYRLVRPGALAVLPPPSEGDIFFDFEGDPLYRETVDGRPRWGLDYLFGLVDSNEKFSAFWAHSQAEEAKALEDFLDFVALRRADHPNMHIYHYAPYERTHLASIAARHAVREAEVDALLRGNVLVDLYAVVRKALLVGSRSYSIKKLEPLYMGEQKRDTDKVAKGDESVDVYMHANELLSSGDAAAAQVLLDEIAQYNEYDCVSTIRLRDWLLKLARAEGVEPEGRPIEDDPPEDTSPDPLGKALLRLAEEQSERGEDADAAALRMAAAAVNYHRREINIFWWEHFTRLTLPFDDWGETRDVFIVSDGRLLSPWQRSGHSNAKHYYREIELHGEFTAGSSTRPGGKPFGVYAYPGPFRLPNAEPGSMPASILDQVQVSEDATTLTAREQLAPGAAEYDDLPDRTSPAPPPPAKGQQEAIARWANELATTLQAQPDDWPAQAAVDLLRRKPPRLSGGSKLTKLVTEAGPDNRVDAIVAAARALDNSYLAVQGPPGTGKTFVGSRTIARLITEHGWRIGVTGQSHKVIENLLAAVVEAGVPKSRILKPVDDPAKTVNQPFTGVKKSKLADHLQQLSGGFVLGGTSWTMTSRAVKDGEPLDLLVIDEAGQFSLADTVACSVAAKRLLLLGDPQQLPQVSNAHHPEPIDSSALGWVSAGSDILPPGYGFFLAETRRMSAKLTSAVSALSYAGALHAHKTVAARHMDAITPGLHPVTVKHYGNSVQSIEEATQVLELVRMLLGKTFTDGETEHPLTSENLIVVTPYNAQVELVGRTLVDAGIKNVRVGTVDKFQGQEAAITIVSLAASSLAEVPRGLEFLLMRNRLNVAISRAKWASYIVYSSTLVDYLPHRPEDLTTLSAFMHLVDSTEPRPEPRLGLVPAGLGTRDKISP